MDDPKDTVIRNQRLDIDSLTAENRRQKHYLALAKDAIAILREALMFYKDDNSSQAFAKYDEIKTGAYDGQGKT